MDNFAIADNFSLLAKLMDIHGENSFKTRTYSVAAFNIEKLPDQLKDVSRDELFRIKGIGESVGNKILEMLETGELALLREYLEKTPPGVTEMLNIKGIGPKKINTIWKEMEIESIGELLYACEENRLTLFKGFGEKTQQNVHDAISFYLQHQGSFLYAQVSEVYPQVQQFLEKLFGSTGINVTGAYRRQEPTIDELEFVVGATLEAIKPKFMTAQPPELLEETDASILYKLKNGLKLRLHAAPGKISETLFLTTGSNEFIDAFQKSFPDWKKRKDKTDSEDGVEKDADIFAGLKIPFIPPSLREFPSIIDIAMKNKLPKLIQPEDIRGIIHSHSNWSDGVNTLSEMANECIKRGLGYLVISDHSKSAFYANGLNEDRIKEQHRQVDELNAGFKNSKIDFRIFKSIESDILIDGNLDYDKKVLASFDMVIASVHSNLKMTEEKAMARVMKAIENPYTIILGHMTSRLLLSRKGFPLDHKKIIEACAKNNVVIELNAHPRRLDIDWRWIGYAIDKGVLLSIDPDAHALDGFDDVKFGVLAAQKGGMTKENNLSSFSRKEFEDFLAKRKKLKGI